MSKACRRVKQACEPCQVHRSGCCQGNEQDGPVDNTVLYANLEATTAKSKVTLNTTP